MLKRLTPCMLLVTALAFLGVSHSSHAQGIILGGVDLGGSQFAEDSRLGDIDDSGAKLVYVPMSRYSPQQVYLHDFSSNLVSILSKNTSGGTGNKDSFAPSLSRNGKFAIFYSLATDLVQGDTNDSLDTFLYNIETKSLSRVSLNSSGAEGTCQHFYYYYGYSYPDCSSNWWSFDSPKISNDGKVALFMSPLSLVPSDTDGDEDLYLKDLATGSVNILNPPSGGGLIREFDMSENGDIIVVNYSMSYYVLGNGIGIYDRNNPTSAVVPINLSSYTGGAPLSVSNLRLSADGRYIAFISSTHLLPTSSSTGKWAAYLYDRTTGVLEHLAPMADFDVLALDMSSDARYFALATASTTIPSLAGADTNGFSDIYVYDRSSGTFTRPSSASNGDQGNGDSVNPRLGADGGKVAFESAASNLVSNDTGGHYDVFVADINNNGSGNSTGNNSNGNSTETKIDGNYKPSAPSVVRTKKGLDITMENVPGATSYEVRVKKNGKLIASATLASNVGSMKLKGKSSKKGLANVFYRAVLADGIETQRSPSTEVNLKLKGKKIGKTNKKGKKKKGKKKGKKKKKKKKSK